MIYSDLKILQAIDAGNIKITPFDRECLGSNSYDVHLGPTLKLLSKDFIYDPKSSNNFHEIVTIPETGYILRPGVFALGATQEVTDSPHCVPMLEGKSSLARLGLTVHKSAGFGDVGFKGSWTLEITSEVPIILYPNMAIAQVYFVEISGMVLQRYSHKKSAKYMNQESGVPVESLMHKNYE